MDSDAVSSINDTDEAFQVATLVQGVYYDLATELGLLEHDGLYELVASGDSTKPTLMTLPTNAIRLDWLRYDKRITGDTTAFWENVAFVPYNLFLDIQLGLRSITDGTTGEMTFVQNSQNFTMMYKNNLAPTYYTTMDDLTFLFDSFDNTVDTTLQASKTMAYGSIYPTFSLVDSFAPDLEPQQFAYFRNRAKVRAFAELKQQVNQEAMVETKNQKVHLQRGRHIIEQLPEVYKVFRAGRKQLGYTRVSKIPRLLRQGT